MRSKLFVRDIDRRETIEVEVGLEEKVEALKREVERCFSLGVDYSLFYRDVELLEEKLLKFYGLEEYDLLVLQRGDGENSSLRENFPEDQERISRGKRWLEKNIGLNTDELDLNEYIRSEDERTEMIFEREDSLYQLKVSEEKIEEYDMFMNEG